MMRTLCAFLCTILPAIGATPRISYATYLGGSAADIANSITTDGDGNYFVAIQTSSTNYPRLPAGQSFAGDLDIVISKFSPTNVLLYSTVVGGSGIDTPYQAVADTDGSLYVSFSTTSTNFPKPPGSILGGGAGGTGVFKLNPAGTLAAVALLTAPAGTAAFGLTLDSSRKVWIKGGSTGIPGQTGTIQAAAAGGADIFVASLNNALTQIGYFT